MNIPSLENLPRLYFTWLKQGKSQFHVRRHRWQSALPAEIRQEHKMLLCTKRGKQLWACSVDSCQLLGPASCVLAQPDYNLPAVSNVPFPPVCGAQRKEDPDSALSWWQLSFLKLVGNNMFSYCQKRSPTAIGIISPRLRGFPSGTRDDRFILIPVSKWIINTPPASCHLIGLSLSPPIVEGSCQL